MFPSAIRALTNFIKLASIGNEYYPTSYNTTGMNTVQTKPSCLKIMINPILRVSKYTSKYLILEIIIQN